MTLRLGNPGDLEAILAIETASFSDPWSEDGFRAAFCNPNCFFYVAEDDGFVVGYILYMSIYEDAEILSLAVDPAFRRRGVARAIVAHAIECAKIDDIEQIFLEVRKSNAAAIALYESFGFEQYRVIKKYYRDPTEDAIAMTLDLGAVGGADS